MTTSNIQLAVMVGSLRADSVNGAVARAAAAHCPDGVELTTCAVTDVPLYNGDIEAAGLPPAVENLHATVGAADGLLICSPEYNGSFPAVTKNAIDWLTRPPKSWEGTATTMVTATPGPRAGLGVRTHFEAIMEHQPVRVFPSLGIGSYGDKFADGELTDAETIGLLVDHLSGFSAFAAEAPTD